MIRIDAHQHFWKYNSDKHSWINDQMQVLKKDFLPEDLSPILKANNIDGCIAVQADQSKEETTFLLDLSEIHDFIFGVVGWVDLCAIDVESRLEYYSQFEKVKGWRHIVQDEPDDKFVLRDDFLKGISLLSKFNYTYDILVYPHLLPATLEMVQMFPHQKFVIDHIAKPKIVDGEIEEWKSFMSQLGALDNVWCKISGMVTEADWVHWQQTDFVPYLKVISDAFNSDKVIYGSDWPVCLLAASYKSVMNIPNSYIESNSIIDFSKFWGQNAIDFYNLEIEDIV